MDTPIELLVHAVAETRAAHARVKGVLDDRRAAFDLAHRDLIDEVATARGAMEAAESAAKATAEALFLATGEKKPAAGISIRETETVSYNEPDAIEWARSAMPALVTTQLDRKAFEKVAKASPLPFVSVTVTGKAVLASAIGVPA